MTTSEMIEAWAATKKHLVAARNLLNPEVAEKNQSALALFSELLAHNDLREAYGFIFPIARMAQWDSVPLLAELALAAKNMMLNDDLAILKARVNSLKTMPQSK